MYGRKMEVNLASVGLRLRKYIELRDSWAAKNYCGPTANISKLRNSCWNVCNGPCSYLKHGIITKDAFSALETPVMGAQVLWLLCLYISLSASPRGYLLNYIFWRVLPNGRAQCSSGERAKSAIYECLIYNRITFAIQSHDRNFNKLTYSLTYLRRSTKIDFGWASPVPPWGSVLVVFKGAASSREGTEEGMGNPAP